VRDVIAAQRVVTDLLLHEAERLAWEAGPVEYASARLESAEAAMVAGLDPIGVAELAASSVQKRAGFEAWHRYKHELLDQRAAELGDDGGGHHHHDDGGHDHHHEDEDHPHDSGYSRRSSPPLTRPDLELRVGCSFKLGLTPYLVKNMKLIDVFEHLLDGFVGAGEDGLKVAESCAAMSAFSLHGINLSLGSPAARSLPRHMEEIGRIIRVMEADVISDHISFCRVDDERLHNFVGLWRIEEQLDLFIENVEWVQEKLGVRLALENVAPLFDPGGEMSEAEFAAEVCRKTGCGLLLDISNVLVNEANGFCDAASEFAAVDLDSVLEVHLGGNETIDSLVRDLHNYPVGADDFVWLERLLPAMPNCRSVIVERDERLEQGDEVIGDVRRAHAVVDRVLEPVRV
jgi:uncharacterized protein (UPF0276 family)